MLSQNFKKAFGVFMLALLAQISLAQKTVTGKVNDANGNPLRGASVTAKGTRVGTQTDANGAFSLSVGNDVKALEISSVGFNTQEVSIESATTVNVTLSLNTSSL